MDGGSQNRPPENRTDTVQKVCCQYFVRANVKPGITKSKALKTELVTSQVINKERILSKSARKAFCSALLRSRGPSASC